MFVLFTIYIIVSLLCMYFVGYSHKYSVFFYGYNYTVIEVRLYLKLDQIFSSQWHLSGQAVTWWNKILSKKDGLENGLD